MKKLSLTLISAALAFTAAANTTVFLMEGTDPARYKGDGDIVVVPIGTILTNAPTEPKCASNITLNKSMMNDQVAIESDRLRKADRSFIAAVPTFYTRCGFLDFRANQTLKVTPAAGLTVTSVKIKGNKVGNEGMFNIVDGVVNDEYNIVGSSAAASDTAQVWTGELSKTFHIVPTKNIQAMYIEVTTTGTSTQVAAPVSSAKYPFVSANQKIELTSATEGAQIYYVIDTEYKTALNEVNIANATLYTEPFTLDKDAVVRAIAVKDGMTNSFPTYSEYYVVPEYTKVAEFNFNSPGTLVNLENKPVATAVLENYFMHKDDKTGGFDKTIHSTIEEPLIHMDTETLFMMVSGKGTITSSSSFGGCTEFRPEQNAKFSFTAPVDYFVSSVLFVSGYTSNGVAAVEQLGTLVPSDVHAAYYIYRNTDNTGESVELTATGTKQYCDHAYVFLTPVEGVGAVDNVIFEQNAPVEYFNLQGIRVANPSNGIFIKRQGNKATKVVL